MPMPIHHPAIVAGAALILSACGGAEVPADAQPARSERALATAAVTATVDASSLFDWAEYTFPDLFPKGAKNQPLTFEGVDYTIRPYANGNYLGLTSGGAVYGLGPFTGNVLTGFGQAADYAQQIAADACKVQPAACEAGLALAAGYDITLALRSDGTVVQSSNALPWTRTATTPLAGSPYTQLSGLRAASLDLDRLYALAVGTDGLLYGWGVNTAGLLGGTEGNGNVPSPRPMSGVTSVQQALATQTYALALQEDGRVWHWPGVLTTTGGNATSTPRTVDGLAGVAALTALGSSLDGARQRPAAILADGRVLELSWTTRTTFAGGSVVTTHSAVATAVPGLVDVRRIACKLSHCLALTRSGSVLEWSGQIGLSSLAVPAAVPGLANVVGIAALADASVALTHDGRVFSWGAGASNGHGGTTDLALPTELKFPATASTVVAGWQHVAVRLSDGSLWSWGANQAGQLGDGTFIDRRTPVKAVGLGL